MRRSFAHLHVHTDCSIPEGASRIADLARAAADDGQPAVAITDGANMHGVLEFYTQCRSQNVKPVLGVELYTTGADLGDERRCRESDATEQFEDGQCYHLTALAETGEGYRNLMRLSSAAYFRGSVGKPRIDWDLLERHHEGVIALTGCSRGFLVEALLHDDVAGAVDHAGRLQDIFGRESLFVELQDHGLESQRRTRVMLVEVARRIGAPLVATNDSHYTRPTDLRTRNALAYMGSGSRLSGHGCTFASRGYYLKTAAQMRALFAELPEACDNTLLFADRANVEITLGRPRLPRFDVPPGFGSQDQYLRHLCFDAARTRHDDLPGPVADRLNAELGLIEALGVSASFLIAWDVIRHAKEFGIRVGPGRGSVAGSLVAYCLGITEIDPVSHHLLSELFLNPGHGQAPHFGLDGDSRFRAETIRYLSEKFGRDHVAQIVAFCTVKPQAAVRGTVASLGLPMSLADRIARTLPSRLAGRGLSLSASTERPPADHVGYRAAGQLRDLYTSGALVMAVIGIASRLEGMRRRTGIHPSAVVISAAPLTDHLPTLQMPEPRAPTVDAAIVTQYDRRGVESLGLFRIDVFRLRHLDVIDTNLIGRERGFLPDLNRIPLDDDATLKLLRSGDTTGVSQMEGEHMQALAQSEDVTALIALHQAEPPNTDLERDYRDRKNGHNPIEHLDPAMKDVLDETYGLVLYREQLMLLAQTFAGRHFYEDGLLCDDLNKKLPDLTALLRNRFVEACTRNGHAGDLSEALFDLIERTAANAQSKSHALSYGLLAFRSAWLRVHFPTEFFSATIHSVADNPPEAARYQNCCTTQGILLPDHIGEP